MPEHPGRNLVRSRRRLALKASPQGFPQVKVENGRSSSTPVLTYTSMQSERRSRGGRKDDPSPKGKSLNHLLSSCLQAAPPSCQRPERQPKTARLTNPVNKNWHGGNAMWHQSGRGSIREKQTISTREKTTRRTLPAGDLLSDLCDSSALSAVQAFFFFGVDPQRCHSDRSEIRWNPSALMNRFE